MSYKEIEKLNVPVMHGSNGEAFQNKINEIIEALNAEKAERCPVCHDIGVISIEGTRCPRCSGKGKLSTSGKLTKEEFHAILSEFPPSIAEDSGQPEWTVGEIDKLWDFLIGRNRWIEKSTSGEDK